MATPFGKTVRKLRIEKDVILKDMADAIGVTSAYLSAVEMGKKRITETLFDKIANFFKLEGVEKEKLRTLVDSSQPNLKISLMDATDANRDLAVKFARNLPQLSDAKRKELEKILGELGL